MPRHSFVRHVKLGDVSGRIDYIQNPKRQEHLYTTYNTTLPSFWDLLAKQNQLDFCKYGTKGKCVEAREFYIALPAVLQKNDPDELLRLFTDAFKARYGVECISALHQNKAMTNYHIHLIFSERKLKEQVEEKVATRNMFYNEAGRHVRTKKEILGADGKVRPGCCIVPKGMVYEISGFQAKEALFKKKSFTDEVRGFYTGLINQLVPEEEKLTVFPRGGPYLATKKIGKNNPKEEEIRKTNALRQEWNAAVSEALSRGVPTGDLIQMKKELIVEPVTRSIRKNGKDPELFILILRKAIKLLIEKARTFRPSVLASLERMKEKAKQQNTKRKERSPKGKILERQPRRMSTPGR